MSNLIDIQMQIEKLQKQASQIKAKEFHKTIVEIRGKMSAFGITVKDLQISSGAKSQGKTKTVGLSKPAKTAGKKVTGAIVPAKYKGPEDQMWSGRGLTPRWLKTLIDGGQTKEDFLIKS